MANPLKKPVMIVIFAVPLRMVWFSCAETTIATAKYKGKWPFVQQIGVTFLFGLGAATFQSEFL